nr:MAG TPA: hypothetical protein [Caudoviricetes sp.]
MKFYLLIRFYTSRNINSITIIRYVSCFGQIY